MPCNKPLKGYRGRGGKLTQKKIGSLEQMLTVPCGSCRGCRIDRSRDWAVRCVHEAQMHEFNCAITLTYSDEHLPKDRSLKKRHFQNFMKELRAEIAPIRVRQFHVGEYGEELGRPHYHALIFGYDFPDKYFWRNSQRGNPQFRSPQLEKLWRKGHSTIGHMTWETAAYCARYVLKKINGKQQEDHYWYVDKETGEAWDVDPEYTTQSNRPGIGATWFERYWRDVYPKDFINVKTSKKLRKFSPPRYYDKLLEEKNPELHLQVKQDRIRKAQERAEQDLLYERQRQDTKEEVLRLRVENQLKRNYEQQ